MIKILEFALINQSKHEVHDGGIGFSRLALILVHMHHADSVLLTPAVINDYAAHSSKSPTQRSSSQSKYSHCILLFTVANNIFTGNH